jgi:hypothetical protein
MTFVRMTKKVIFDFLRVHQFSILKKGLLSFVTNDDTECRALDTLQSLNIGMIHLTKTPAPLQLCRKIHYRLHAIITGCRNREKDHENSVVAKWEHH